MRDHLRHRWALTGGENFGVVTGFVFQLPNFDGQELAGARYYPIDQLRRNLEFHRELTAKTSDDVIVYNAAWVNPVDESNAAAIAFCHSGSSDEAEQEMAGPRNLGGASLDILSNL